MELQKDLNTDMDDNKSLLKKLKNATDNLGAKQTQIEILVCDKSDALEELEYDNCNASNKLELANEKSKSGLESFRV